MSTLPPLQTSTDRRHRRWAVVIGVVSFVTLIGAAGFRSVPGVLMQPLHEEFGWSHGTIGAAVSVNLVLFGLMSPFAAALMDRFGVRRVVSIALTLVAAGTGLTIFMREPWQLMALWGAVVGIGTGSMSMTFVATMSSRWYVRRRGLVSGILTAGNATGQLVFLPLIAALAGHHGWRTASLVVAAVSLLTVPVVLLLLRDHPHDLGLHAYGATADDPGPARARGGGSSAGRALAALAGAARTRTFWLLAGGFAICGATTNGLIGTHFVPAAHDHGMPATTAAGLLAVVGIFDVLGTIASGWLTDRFDPRLLLGLYYAGRGVALVLLPHLLAPGVEPSMWAFILVYGLDWVATVPPTVAICRGRFGLAGPIVFGWVFASHQLGAAAASWGAGFVRDVFSSYDLAWYGGAALCAVGAGLSLAIAPTRRLREEAERERVPA
ncbi:MFS transporter [Agilicoccus flavus]|uniref:MFS transporter n=1 Tax=Agilicoccus flavus TaxID=2775968 RepID=UPI001CF69D2D|nr:MFS transporter [Agilicoccus flavus]